MEMTKIFPLSLLLFISNVNSFIGDWQAFQSGYTIDQCYQIPDNFTLCSNVGYRLMVLPNYIQHESIEEAAQHSKVWMGLVNTQCHVDIKKFICSLYAPVCISNQRNQKVPPCRELCVTVKESCLPSMKMYGFDWPTIMKCSKFPQFKNSLCIPKTVVPGKKCDLCMKIASYEVIANRFCLSPIVIRAKIKRIIPTSGNAIQIILQKKSKFLKFQANFSQNALELNLKCNCTNLKFKQRALKGRWIIMAQIDSDNKAVVNFISKWKRKKAEFKHSMKIIQNFGHIVCKSKLPDGISLRERYAAYLKMNNQLKYSNERKLQTRKFRKQKSRKSVKPNNRSAGIS
uniref:Secreted frizzled-related protein 1 n=1 Tax=Schmidtea mediterranea TaxID=79327 RepID=B0LMG1_SCHMD|nr:secreted frizzled-related protein 1 [Schmidtea mediterranea]AQT19786.1 hypothetical protein Smed-sfrp1 [Schmidtea mediterranea]